MPPAYHVGMPRLPAAAAENITGDHTWYRPPAPMGYVYRLDGRGSGAFYLVLFDKMADTSRRARKGSHQAIHLK